MELFAKCIAKTKYHPVSGGVGILSVLKWGKYKSGVIKTQKIVASGPALRLFCSSFQNMHNYLMRTS